jgi:hypothetical protein
MTPERTADRNDEDEVEGQGYRIRATEDPPPDESDEAEVEGQVMIRYKATGADRPQPCGDRGTRLQDTSQRDASARGCRRGRRAGLEVPWGSRRCPRE